MADRLGFHLRRHQQQSPIPGWSIPFSSCLSLKQPIFKCPDLMNTSVTPERSFLEKVGRHWFEVFLFFYGVWIFAPFLAPLFMHAGWTGVGRAIYLIYSFFCHQLPERSFFFFGL